MQPACLFRLPTLCLAAVCAALLVTGCDTNNPDEGEDATRYTVSLTGAAEQPDPVFTEGSGSADLRVNEEGSAIEYTVRLSDIDDVSQGHIHIGGAEENGPVVAFLFQFAENTDGTGEGETQSFGEEAVAAEGTITAEDVIARPEAGFDGSIEALTQALAGGNAYVNVHSEAFPAGEIRAQINADAQPSYEQTTDATLAGSNEVPPVETDASGSATLGINAAGDALTYTVRLADIDGVTQGHIHIGGPEENGPVVVPLFVFNTAVDGSGDGETESFGEEAVAAEGTITVDDVSTAEGIDFDGSIEALLNAVVRGNAYVNVHSEAFPAGEIRSQTVEGDDSDGDGATADVTISVENVGASAWEVTSVEGADGVATTDEENPELTLSPGTRYRIESSGGAAHPFAFQDADENFLLVQDFSDEEGSYEDDDAVDFVSDDAGITFTLTEDLAGDLARYLCTIHRGAMNGSVSVADNDG